MEPGTIVYLRSTSESPLGGWIHGEQAIICEGNTPNWASILVRLCDERLAESIRQDGIPEGLIAVNLENIDAIIGKCDR